MTTIKVGDKVMFHRGMYGQWAGKVRRIRYSTKRYTFGNRRVSVADVSFSRANGTFGKAVVSLDNLISVLDTRNPLL